MSQKIKMGVRFPKKTTLFFGEKNQQWEFNSQKRQLYFFGGKNYRNSYKTFLKLF